MAEDQQDYPAILKRVSPTQAVDVLTARVQQVGRLNVAIADWLQERRRLEEQYATGLQKLARTQIDVNDLGVFSVPWGQITSAIETLAESHSSLSSVIGADVERPLRDFANQDASLHSLATARTELMPTATDFERAQQKADRLQSRGENLEANKVAAVSAELEQTRSQWENQAPALFAKLQTLDETRLELLRDHLTQLQTLEAEHFEKHRAGAEQSLNALLNVETQDEIKTFAIKAAASNSGYRARRASLAGPTPTSSRAAASTSASTFAGMQLREKDGESPSTPDGSKKGFKGGLKRLGTVMGRKSKQPQQSSASSSVEAPDRKSKSSFNSFGKLGRSKDSYQGGLEPPQEEPATQDSFLGDSSSVNPGLVDESVFEDNSRTHESSAVSNGHASPPVIPRSTGMANGSSRVQSDLRSTSMSQDRSATVQSPASQRDEAAFSTAPQSLDPISQAQAEAAMFGGDSTQPQFNVNIRNAPIQEEGGDAALKTVANKLQAPPPATRRSGTVRGRRDARNSAIVNNYGGVEQPAESSPVTVASPDFDQASSSSLQLPATSSSQANRTSLSTFGSSILPPVVSTPPASIPPLSAFSEPLAFRPSSKQTVAAADLAGDNQSIRSGRSLTSTGSQGNKHPELTETGLSSSIIETISARFEKDQLVSSSLIGEIALAYNAADFTTPFGQETIRLDNFGTLEKVAPNPAFVNQVPARQGEFTINLGSIARTQLAFKYQFGHDQASSQVPILVTTAYKIEASQTSVIVSYSLHPAFTLRAHESISVSNLALALTLEGARSSGCQSRPVGTFSKDKNLIFWQLGDVVLAPGVAPQKLLARFTTDGEATGGSVESKWEITGANARGLGSGIAVSVLQSSGAVGDGADPFADEQANAAAAGAWRPVLDVKKLVSGIYATKS